jgi:hypothetical protein
LAEIEVHRTDGEGRRFRVTVREGGAGTVHEVTVAAEDLERTGAKSAEALVERSFEFLLERETKESILRRFELSVIGRYFPEYWDEIGRRVADG